MCTVHEQKTGITELSGQSSDTAVGYGDLDFLYNMDILAISGHSLCDPDF